MLKIHGMVYETLLENEENQIRGFVHVVDAAGVNLPYMTLFTPKEAVRIVKNAEVILNIFVCLLQMFEWSFLVCKSQVQFGYYATWMI